MFGKLLKWDIRNQKEILILYLVMILSTLLAVATTRITFFSQFAFIGEITIVLAFILNAAGAVVLLVLNILYYYKTMHGSSGYLHHSIPATTNMKLLSKWVSMFIYWVILFVLVFVNLNFLFKAVPFADTSLFSIMRELFNELSNAFQVSPILLIFLFIFIIAFAIMAQIISMSTVLTVGSTGWFQKKGKLGIVLSYILFSVVGQILGFIGLLIPLNLGVTEQNGRVVFRIVQMSWSLAESNPGGIIPIGSLILGLVSTIVMIIITKTLLNKKLNVI